MRYNLLKSTNKSVATLFQACLDISYDKRSSRGLSFNIFDKRSDYLSFRLCPSQYWANTLLIWHLILSCWYLGGQCVGFVSFLL